MGKIGFGKRICAVALAATLIAVPTIGASSLYAADSSISEEVIFSEELSGGTTSFEEITETGIVEGTSEGEGATEEVIQEEIFDGDIEEKTVEEIIQEENVGNIAEEDGVVEEAAVEIIPEEKYAESLSGSNESDSEIVEADFVDSGRCSSKAKWGLIRNPDGDSYTMTIYGEGSMGIIEGWFYEYDTDDEGWLYNNVTNVIIKEGITDVCFAGLTSLKSISIPETVTSIQNAAFAGCSNLQKITIPETVTSIGQMAFSGCKKLKSVNIPETVTSIGNNAFDGCSALKSINCPKGVTSMGTEAFKDCINLTQATIQGNAGEYDMFSGCNNLLKVEGGTEDGINWILDKTEGTTCRLTIRGKGSMEDFQARYFWSSYDFRSNCPWLLDGFDITDISIGEGIEHIGGRAFCSCDKLTEITIPNSVTSIGAYAFSSSGLETVDIPDSVVNIEEGAFNRCKSLKSVDIPDQVTRIAECTFRYCGGLTDIDIPDCVTDIGSNAFFGCYSLANISLPSELASVNMETFKNCTSLKTVTIPESVSNIYINAFTGCTALDTLILNGTYTTIRDDSFKKLPALREVFINAPVTKIGSYAFSSCTNLQIVHLPVTLSEVAAGGFRYDTQLAMVYYSGSTSEWNNIKIAKYNEPLLGAEIICQNVDLYDLSQASVIMTGGPYAYTGKAITPELNVTIGNTKLEEGRDYSAQFADNADVGTAVVTVKGVGKYKGQKIIKFVIEKAQPELIFASKSISKTTVDEPFINELTQITDGAVSFKSSKTQIATVDKTSGKVTIKGEGSVTITATAAEGTRYKAGSAAYIIKVTKGTILLSQCSVTLSSSNYTYNGNAQLPSVTVKNGTTELVNGTDYSVLYKDNKNAGTATVIVTGKGNYSGVKEVTFSIHKAESVLKFAANDIAKRLNDSAFVNKLTKTTDGNVTFKSSNTNVATVNKTSGKVTIKGVGVTAITAHAEEGVNYKAGSESYVLTVMKEQVSISECNIALSKSSFIYNGKARKPVVTIKDGTIKLIKNADYTVKYQNNVNAGTATVIVTGKGDYKDTNKVTFTIEKADPSLEFAKNGLVKRVKDSAFTNNLTKATDAAVIFKSSDTTVATVNKTSGKVTIKGTGAAAITAFVKEVGNYNADSVSYVLIVKPAKIDISACTASTKYATYEYTGKARKPSLSLKLKSTTLSLGKDYTVTYKNNKAVGTAIITAKGIGDYTGTKTCTFRIVKKQTIIPVYRLFNTRTGEHFYTKSIAERTQYLKAGNWNDEGIAWYAPSKSSEPIYRVSNPNGGNEHHYTKSKKEKDWLVSLGWNYDCIAWYSDTNKTIPVYRHYQPTQRTGNHHYTTSKGESDHIVKYEGWKYEGISFYVSKAGG